MESSTNKIGIIFDLDGTLWDTSKQVLPAWNTVLARHKELDKRLTLHEMESFFGKRIEEIAALMLPNVNEEKRLRITHECCQEEQIYLSQHGGTLYPYLRDVLSSLAKNYHLYIVSNCQDGYVQCFLGFHKLEGYFSDIEMSGRTGQDKGDNIKLLMDRNNLKQAVYVGDTTGDFTAANKACIPFIHAQYGFGKVPDAKYAIAKIEDLPKLIPAIII